MAEQFVKGKIRADKVIVFGKASCPYCHQAMDLLKQLRVKPSHLEFVDIGGRSDTEAIQSYFQQTTGARTVPRVYIGEICIGGFSDLQELHSKGELIPKLKQIGVL
ncbi:glutaredoxin-1 [Tiliqua scincoides]|uniref:glutaredoxin-1 n=1 Tax=Tiliqua scincoides TaxID=71010 RepID=UPI0034633D1A